MNASQQYTIGIDVGTSSAKAVLINGDGQIIATASREYQLLTPHPDWCELHPETYWECTEYILKVLVGKVNPEHIRGISFSSQAETLICVDEQGIPLRNAIVWLDNRSQQEAIEIEQYFSTKSIYDITGQPEVVPTWPATKIAWLRKNEPEVFAQTHKFLMVEDYLLYKFTGSFITEASVSSSTLYMDIHTRTWWPAMLAFLQITEQQLPQIVPSGIQVGFCMLHEIELLNCVIISGAYDHAAGAIGAGNIAEGMVTETTGSSMAMVITTTKPVIDKALNLPCQVHAIEGLYFLLPYGQTAGMALKWFRDVFGTEEKAQAALKTQNAYDLLTELASQVTPGADGLIMLPHLAGAGSPEFNTHCRGVFAGISLHMTKGHFVRALMESVACMVAKNINQVHKAGIQINEIRALGGGSKSTLWNQIKADVTGLPVYTLHVEEAPALGAAILAGVGAGLFPNITEACKKTVATTQIYTPQSRSVYKDVYRKYNKLYEALKEWW